MLHPALTATSSAVSATVGYLGRLADRRGLYTRARDRANELRRPLVVVGAPAGGRAARAVAQHECGDLPCVATRGCPACGTGPTDPERVGAIPVADDTAVVYAAGFERAADPYALYAEVLRAAGTPGNVFVVRADPTALTRLAGAVRWRIVEAPPVETTFDAMPLRRAPRTIARVTR